MYIYEERYEKLNFFKNREVNFIVWMCPNLKPRIFQLNDYICMEDEIINDIFFMTQGSA